jgi:protease-4
MHAIHLLSTILKGKWLIDPNFAMTQGSVIAAVINKQTAFEEVQPNPLTAYAVAAKEVNSAKYSWNRGFNMAPPKSVAVVSLKGPLMKEDMLCGPAGTSTIGQIIQEADNHQNIDAIVLHIDSPGGTVDGTEALAAIVKNTKKPVVSFVDGLMASAALWIGSSANEVIASTDTDEIGSVGVLMRFTDLQPFWENQGVKFHTITASTSPEKVKMWEELRAGNYDNYIKEVLDPLDKKFMDAIRQNCPSCEEKHLTGKVFFARDVMGVFVNSIGSLGDAVLRAYELANPETGISNNLNHTSSMKQFTKLNAALGVDSLEAVDETVSLNEEQLELVESALNISQQAIADARTEAESHRDAAQTELQIARTNLSNAMAAFDAIDPAIAAADSPEAKAAAVRALLAGIPGVKIEGNLETGDAAGSRTTEEDWDAINSLPHNLAVDQNF